MGFPRRFAPRKDRSFGRESRGNVGAVSAEASAFSQGEGIACGR